jgi:hypothetical protein
MWKVVYVKTIQTNRTIALLYDFRRQTSSEKPEKIGLSRARSRPVAFLTWTSAPRHHLPSSANQAAVEVRRGSPWTPRVLERKPLRKQWLC